MPSSRILVTVLLAAFAFPAICQKPQIVEVKQIPDFVLYDSYFYRVAWLDNHAKSIRSQGKSDTNARSAIRRQGSLTSTEETALKAIEAGNLATRIETLEQVLKGRNGEINQ